MYRRRYQKRGNGPRFHLSPQARGDLLAIVCFVIAAILLLAALGLAASAGQALNNLLTLLTGQGRFLLVPLFVLLGLFQILPTFAFSRIYHTVGLILLFIGLLGLLAIMNVSFPNQGWHGGTLGFFVMLPFFRWFGSPVTFLIFFAASLAGLLLAVNLSLQNLATSGSQVGRLTKIGFLPFFWLGRFFRRPSAPRILEGGEPLPPSPSEPSFITREIPLFKSKQKKEAVPAVALPPSEISEFTEGLRRRGSRRVEIPLDILNEKSSKPTAGDIKKNMEIIERTLNNFGISVQMGDVSIGPTVTQFTFKPQEGIKLTRVTALANDLALALASHPLRMEAPIPGKSLVGLEVPNQTVATVGLREVLDSAPFRERKHSLQVALGKDVAGHPWFADLPRLPHLLVAGATGSGKTVCLNAMIVSLLYQNSPDDLKFILIDPKRVELPVYNGIPHLLVPTITDVPKTINALKWTLGEMERRFRVLEEAGSRDITSYNKTSDQPMPTLVLVVDELADLMAAAAREIESGVIRVAQMARAVGIHLILATQRPSVDVITGLIKANIPARIAFAVASQTDSRTILDSGGAEKLLGRGDMLFTAPELSKPRRIQGAFVSDEEIRRVVNFLTSEYEAPSYNTAVIEKQKINLIGTETEMYEDADPLLDEVKEVILQAGKASASLLQRRLKVGYARAARLLDLLEREGFIGPADGAKPREILLTSSTPTVFSSSESEEGDEERPPWGQSG